MGKRRGWVASAGVAMLTVAMLTAGCAALFGPRDVQVSQAQLQQAVERRFPLERRYLELLDVTVAAHPRGGSAARSC